jgi:hypothetical protein
MTEKQLCRNEHEPVEFTPERLKAENTHNFHEGSPPQGPSGARPGQFVCFSEISVVDPPRGAPPGAAAYIIIGGMEVSTPLFCL